MKLNKQSLNALRDKRMLWNQTGILLREVKVNILLPYFGVEEGMLRGSERIIL